MEEKADADDVATDQPIDTRTRVPTDESEEKDTNEEAIFPQTRAA